MSKYRSTRRISYLWIGRRSRSKIANGARDSQFRLLVPTGYPIRSNVALWPGIDILAAGSSVILPGSRTEVGEYRALRTFDECLIPKAPREFVSRTADDICGTRGSWLCGMIKKTTAVRRESVQATVLVGALDSSWGKKSRNIASLSVDSRAERAVLKDWVHRTAYTYTDISAKIPLIADAARSTSLRLR